MKTKAILILFAVAGLFLFLERRIDAHPATGIVVDHKGNVFFSDLETIWKLDPDGTLSVFRPESGQADRAAMMTRQYHGADVSYESQKFIEDVWKMTPEGKLTYLLEPTANPPRGMSIWRDHEGNIRVTRTIIQTKHSARTPRQVQHLRKRRPRGRTSALAAWGMLGRRHLPHGRRLRSQVHDGTVTTSQNYHQHKDNNLLADLNLAGLPSPSVFLADAGNRRLLKVSSAGKVDVVLRSEPPYFPNGAVATASGDVYVLEVGFTMPNISSGPRIRKLFRDGKSPRRGRRRR